MAHVGDIHHASYRDEADGDMIPFSAAPSQVSSLFQGHRQFTQIKNLISGQDKIAKEAVLSCIHQSEVHTAPHGQQAQRLVEAEKNVKDMWGYLLAGRTMWSNVQKMMKDHVKEEKRKDNETGTEYDLDTVDVRIIHSSWSDTICC